MGMYSRMTRHCISVRPGMLGKLKECLKKHRNRKKHYYYSLVEINGKKVSLEKLDGHKIISYWYDDFCKFLKDIAQYINGQIVFAFESDAEGPAYVCFEDGKVKIHLPVWHELTPDDIIRTRRERKAEMDRQVSKTNKRVKLMTRAKAIQKTTNSSPSGHRNQCPRCGGTASKGTATCCGVGHPAKGVQPQG